MASIAFLPLVLITAHNILAAQALAFGPFLNTPSSYLSSQNNRTNQQEVVSGHGLDLPRTDSSSELPSNVDDLPRAVASSPGFRTENHSAVALRFSDSSLSITAIATHSRSRRPLPLVSDIGTVHSDLPVGATASRSHQCASFSAGTLSREHSAIAVPLPAKRSITSHNTTQHRPRSSAQSGPITSQPMKTVTSTQTNDNGSTTVMSATVYACAAIMPAFSHISWVQGVFSSHPNVLTNADGTVFTTAVVTAESWAGVGNINKHEHVTSIAYPTQYWDYPSYYSCLGSTIGADPSCGPDYVGSYGCQGRETLRGHPKYTTYPTVQDIVSKNSKGIGYIPIWVIELPGTQELHWLSSRFPEAQAIRECQTTQRSNAAHMIIYHPTALAEESQAESITLGVNGRQDSPTITSGLASTGQAQPANLPATIIAPTLSSTDQASSVVTSSAILHIDPAAAPVDSSGPSQTASNAADAGQPPIDDATGAAQILSAALTVHNDESPSKPTRIPSSLITFEHIVVQPSDNGVVVDGYVITPGQTTTLGTGSSTTLVGLVIGSSGETILRVGNSRTTMLEAPQSQQTIQVGAATVTRSSDIFFIGGKTIAVGQTITVALGSLTTLVAAKTDPSGSINLVVGSSTVKLAPASPARTLSFNGEVFTESDDGFLVGGQSVAPGHVATLGSGLSERVIAVDIDAAGSTELIVDSMTTTISAPSVRQTFTLDGLAVTNVGDSYIIADQTIRPGQTVTITSDPSAIPLAVQTDLSGHTRLIIGSSTVMVPIWTTPVTTAGLTLTSFAINTIVINGQTLTLGGPVTPTSGSQTTKVPLATDCEGRPCFLKPNTTIVLNSTTTPQSYLFAGPVSSVTSSSAFVEPSISSTQMSPAPNGGSKGGLSGGRLAALLSLIIVMCTSMYI